MIFSKYSHADVQAHNQPESGLWRWDAGQISLGSHLEKYCLLKPLSDWLGGRGEVLDWWDWNVWKRKYERVSDKIEREIKSEIIFNHLIMVVVCCSKYWDYWDFSIFSYPPSMHTFVSIDCIRFIFNCKFLLWNATLNWSCKSGLCVAFLFGYLLYRIAAWAQFRRIIAGLMNINTMRQT